MKKICLLIVIISNFYFLNAQDYWMAFHQNINVSTNKEIKFKIQASVKVLNKGENGKAQLWARVDNKDDEMGFFDNMDNRPVISGNWETYIVEGTLNEKSEKLFFGGLVYYNGDFYYDNFELFIENENGEYEKIQILNSNFEKQIENNKIPNWDFMKFDENVFSVSSVIEKGTNNSLVIKGFGIKTENVDIYKIGPKDGDTTSPQIATLISMLNNLSYRVELAVKNLDQRELDWLIDEEANSIGALILHLAAAEKWYQVYTFEETEGFHEEDKEFWDIPMDLDEKGRQNIKGHDAKYYLDIYKEVRKKTIELLKTKDDEWLKKVTKSGLNNHFCWFHVMEHQSSHLGQMLLLKKRIPPAPIEEKPLEIKEKLKN